MKEAVLFDFDGTVIRGDSVVALILFAFRRRCLSPRDLFASVFYGVLYRIGLTDALTAKKKAHRFIKKLPSDFRERFLRDFARRITQRAYPEALREMEKHRNAGKAVILCSASCECYMRFVAENLPADHLLCTPCETDGTVIGPNCRGEEKVRRINLWLAENGLSAGCLAAGYGDSAGDIPMLNLCAQQMLVNPKRKLRRSFPAARCLNWNQDR